METQEYRSGNLEISDDVIATIALVSAKEVEGVATTVGKAPVEIGGKGIKINGKAAMKGVKVEREGDTVSLEISIGVNYGCMLRDVAAKVQENIYHAIETMTGLAVKTITVNIISITVDAAE